MLIEGYTSKMIEMSNRVLQYQDMRKSVVMSRNSQTHWKNALVFVVQL